MGNRLSKIYTRTGDDGTTGLGDGTRVAKDSARVASYGTVDELNSVIGVGSLSRPLLSPSPSVHFMAILASISPAASTRQVVVPRNSQAVVDVRRARRRFG